MECDLCGEKKEILSTWGDRAICVECFCHKAPKNTYAYALQEFQNEARKLWGNIVKALKGDE